MKPTIPETAARTAAELRVALAELLLRLPQKDRRDLLRDARDRQAQQKTTGGASMSSVRPC